MWAYAVRVSVAILVLMNLNGCGSTSSLRQSDAPADASPSAMPPAMASDFSRYSDVLVRDFVNENSMQPKDEANREKLQKSTDAACKRFADLIADGLSKSGAFASVRREGEATPETLVIDGVITKYDPSNLVFRLVPVAGSAEFDARVAFTDGASSSEVSYIAVDKNSWLLGGTTAVFQSVDSLVRSAASKVISESVRAKKGNP